MATGSTGTLASAARYAAPSRNRRAQPSGDRVPSGYISTDQPSASSRSGVSDRPMPLRSIGKVENASAEPTARHPAPGGAPPRGGGGARGGGGRKPPGRGRPPPPGRKRSRGGGPRVAPAA